jgi:hypothetical protein
MPTSLADAELILTCYGGTNWRDLFVLGLGAIVFFGGLLLVVVLALRAAR